MDRGPALISHDFGLYLEGRGLGHILASPHELPVGNAWYNTERYHEGLPRGAWQRHAGRCILRPTGKHLEPSAETQSKDAGASPASKPGNGQAERNRPHRETLTCAKGITVSLPLKTYRLIRKNIKEMMRMPPVKAENNRPTMESKE